MFKRLGIIDQTDPNEFKESIIWLECYTEKTPAKWDKEDVLEFITSLFEKFPTNIIEIRISRQFPLVKISAPLSMVQAIKHNSKLSAP
ncbi:MAG: hypothetical protein AB1523_09735 [Bacillota bacterium]